MSTVLTSSAICFPFFNTSITTDSLSLASVAPAARNSSLPRLLSLRIWCAKNNEHQSTQPAEKCSSQNTFLLADDPEFEASFGKYINVMEYVSRRRTRRSSPSRSSSSSRRQSESRSGEKKRREDQVSVKFDRDTWKSFIQESKNLNRKPLPLRELYLAKPDEEQSDANSVHKAFEFLTEASLPALNLETRVQRLTEKLNKSGKMRMSEFSKLMYTAKIKFSDYSMHRLVQVLGQMGNWRRILQLIDWLQSSERYTSYSTRYMYTTVLSILGRVGRAKEALVVFNAMREDFSSYPDLAAYHSIAVTLGQSGYIRELVDLMDALRQGADKSILKLPLRNWDSCLHPDLIVYNALINACVQRKQWKGAIWVLKKMYESGTKPNAATYGLVMEAMLQGGKLDLVSNYFAKMQSSGLTPNVLTYKVLVQAYCKEGRVEKAIETVASMEKKGIVGTAGLYYELACGLCSVGKSQEALSQIEKIQKVGHKPLYVAYTGLIYASAKSGFVSDSIYIFDQMQRTCTPNIDACNLMLKVYTQNNLINEIKTLFQQIRSGRVGLHCGSANSEPIKPNFNTYHTLLNALASVEDWNSFENVYQDMLQEGFLVNHEALSKLVLVASRAGKGHLLGFTYERFASTRRLPHVCICRELVLQSIEVGDYPRTCEYLRKMVKAGFDTNKSQWMQQLNSGRYTITRENVVALLNVAREFKLTKSTNIIYTNFLNTFQAVADQYT